MRDNFLKALLEVTKKDQNTFLITGDLGFKIFDNYIKKFKNRFLNVGVAEQNMIGIASAMSLRGYKVIVYSIANFGTLRCLEQIRNDAAYHNSNITIVASGGGYTYGSLGVSHHATEDIGILRSLPNIKVFVPSSGVESYLTTKKIINLKGVKYLRIEKTSNIKPLNKKIDVLKPIIYRKGNDGIILTSGGILSECIDSADKLFKNKKINLSIYSLNCIKPFNKNFFKKLLKVKYIISVEEHNYSCGIGSSILENLNKLNIKKNIKIIAIKDRYSSMVGDQNYMRRRNNLNSKSIQNEILKFFNDAKKHF